MTTATLPAFAELASQHATDPGPAAVWRHFETLCLTPRLSKHEATLREKLKSWAEARGIASEIDAAGNLILRKPATPGHEQAPGVVLQGHIDMVCQANSGVSHDFLRDPIRPVLRDGWMVAEQTTLGADNGIGVALGLAALETPGLVHGPLEVLLTVDEEDGMGGAQGLQAGTLHGSYLLNLDTEDWGEFYIGCAGGVDVNVSRAAQWVAPGADRVAFSLHVTGLSGGHSGCDIHLGRGNAIKSMLRALVDLRGAGIEASLAQLRGGTARNAIPREADALFVVPAAQAQAVAARLAQAAQAMKAELADLEPGLRFDWQPAPLPAQVLEATLGATWLDALHAAPLGVRRMSSRVPGVVETSNNLGVIGIDDGRLHANLMVRSLVDSAGLALAEECASLFRLAGCEVALEGHYPGWRPNPDSPLLATCRAVYAREFGAAWGESAVKVVHAGLECGIIGGVYPQLDMVSFGPTIRGAHAPGERVEVAAVARSWHLLAAILKELAQ